MMKIFVLLLVTAMTGCDDAPEEINGSRRREGWVDFTCTYPEAHKRYNSVDLKSGDKTLIQTHLVATWENLSRFHIYHNMTNQNVRVIVRQLLQRSDFKKYKCGFIGPDSEEEDSDEEDSDDRREQEVNLKLDGAVFKDPFNQTAYTTAKTTVTCEYPEQERSKVKFFCKDSGFICEDILSTEPHLRSNGTFSLNITGTGFNVSISNVSTQHLGDYWCGLKSDDGTSRAGLKKIHLKVEQIPTSNLSLAAGQTFKFRCDYPNSANVQRYFCKGEDPSLCHTVISRKEPHSSTERITWSEDHWRTHFNITMNKVTEEDTGTYWCGAKRFPAHNDMFYHRVLLTVVPETTSTPSMTSSTSPLSSTPTTPASGKKNDVSWSPRIIAVVVCGVVLVLLIILVLVYKRWKRSETWTNGEAREDRAYEEIQEGPRKPDSGTALPTIYATANFPTISSVPPGYSVITFKNSSDANGYSTVRHPDRSPAYSTVNHPSSTPSEDPVYFTLSTPQQH